MPEPEHPLYKEFRLLELKSLGGDYADQKSLLEALYEKTGIDRFVASFSAAQKDDGETLSYCVWSNVDTLLPKTQKVAFIREGEEVAALGGWETVVAVVGELMETLDMHPPRYRVTEFPNEEQLMAIGKEEL